MHDLNDELKHVALQIAMAKKIITDQFTVIEALRREKTRANLTTNKFEVLFLI